MHLRWVAAVAAVAGKAACSGGGQSRARAADVESGRVAVHLMHTDGVPRAFRELGVDDGLMLPSGWAIDRTGIQRSGSYLIFGAYRGSPNSGSIVPPAGRAESTWVVDVRSGRGYRYAQINRGWYAPSEIGAAGYLVRKEVQQLPGNRCHPNRGDDCFEWRLYGQRLFNGRPQLLDQSKSPGSQANSPSLASDDRTIAWEAGQDGKHFAIYRWSPGADRPIRIATQSTPDRLQYDGGRLYVVQPASQAVTPVPTFRVIELSGTAGSEDHSLGTFRGQPPSYLNDGSILHFPYGGGSRGGRWYLKTFSPSSDKPVGAPVSGAYVAVWISATRFLCWSANGWDLMSTVDRHVDVHVAGPDSGLAVPRPDGGLAVGFNGYQNRAVVGVR
jgi:hypothetical protein